MLVNLGLLEFTIRGPVRVFLVVIVGNCIGVIAGDKKYDVL